MELFFLSLFTNNENSISQIKVFILLESNLLFSLLTWASRHLPEKHLADWQLLEREVQQSNRVTAAPAETSLRRNVFRPRDAAPLTCAWSNFFRRLSFFVSNPTNVREEERPSVSFFSSVYERECERARESVRRRGSVCESFENDTSWGQK